MPEMDGVSAIRQMTDLGIPARVLVLTTFDTDSDVLPAIEAGATGYLLKDAPRDDLLRAVRAAAAGEAVLSPSVAARLLDQVRQPVKETVSQRELEVLQLIASGATNREVAERLFISEATVKTHLLHIYAKLGVNDRAAAVGAAFETGPAHPWGGAVTLLSESGRELLHRRGVVLGGEGEEHHIDSCFEQCVGPARHLRRIGVRFEPEM